MVFKKVEALGSQRDAIKGRLRFWEENLNLDTYLGVLDLHAELSTTTKTKQPDPDDSLKPFALAVPRIQADDDLKKKDLLPGAPFSFQTGKPQLFVNATDLLNDAKAFNFTPQAIKMISDYFASDEGANVRSFMSMPIPSPSLQPGALPIGVLNVHRNKEGLFSEQGNKKGIELFAPLAMPFAVILARLLAQYDLTVASSGGKL